MDLEVFDLEKAIGGDRDVEMCIRLSSCLRDTGCLVVRDPRVKAEDNDRFLDLMEEYFSQPESFKARQIRADLHYQVGLTPEGKEIPESFSDPTMMKFVDRLGEEDKPHIPIGPDVKCRYMWRIGARPGTTEFWELNADPVVPEGIKDWESIMNGFGEKLLNTLYLAADLLGVGLGLKDSTVVRRIMQNGPHMLAPTGVDLSKHRAKGTVIAGFHTDLNLMTIHGKSRFSGLHVWLRNGRRVAVRIPNGCLLIQAGDQLERLTGGYIEAGMHEVVVVEGTIAALEAAEATGKCTWRVSSTLFGHAASDQVLEPLEWFRTGRSEDLYPRCLAGEYVESVLKKIRLHSRHTASIVESSLA